MELLILIGLPAVVGAIAMAVARYRDFKRHRQARQDLVCGQCGYSVIGLDRMLCPECGNDLREAGISRRGYHPTLEFGGTLILLALALVVAGPLSSSLIRQLAPVRVSYQATVALNELNSPAILRVWISASGEAWAGTQKLIPVKVRLETRSNTSATSQPVFSFDAVPQDNALVLKGYGGSTPRESIRINNQSILDWIGAQGLKTDDPLIAEDAKNISLAIHVCSTMRATAQLRSHTSRGAFDNLPESNYSRRFLVEPAPMLMMLHQIACWGIGIFGSVYIVLVTRRGPRADLSSQIAAADHASADAPLMANPIRTDRGRYSSTR